MAGIIHRSGMSVLQLCRFQRLRPPFSSLLTCVVILPVGVTALKSAKDSSKQQHASFITISHAGSANQRRAGDRLSLTQTDRELRGVDLAAAGGSRWRLKGTCRTVHGLLTGRPIVFGHTTRCDEIHPRDPPGHSTSCGRERNYYTTSGYHIPPPLRGKTTPEHPRDPPGHSTSCDSVSPSAEYRRQTMANKYSKRHTKQKALGNETEQASLALTVEKHQRQVEVISGSAWQGFRRKVCLLVPYMWPGGSVGLQALVILCVGLLALERVINVFVPIYSRNIVNQLSAMESWRTWPSRSVFTSSLSSCRAEG
ncbi:hypothetical protein G5714_010497 [Onychostoma macrolepis]|uniref:Uncharacterized protein n=1 Tax=Onychostoma macrolepis TaxID=369639 RepID=A0A7J6CR26_9TELE|nr:hypothetical protein G5714_010497 [Onychostoma macrolepis]